MSYEEEDTCISVCTHLEYVVSQYLFICRNLIFQRLVGLF